MKFRRVVLTVIALSYVLAFGMLNVMFHFS